MTARNELLLTLSSLHRAHVGRRTEQGRNLTTSKRFNDGLQQRKLQAAGKEQMDGKNDASEYNDFVLPPVVSLLIDPRTLSRTFKLLGGSVRSSTRVSSRTDKLNKNATA